MAALALVAGWFWFDSAYDLGLVCVWFVFGSGVLVVCVWFVFGGVLPDGFGAVLRDRRMTGGFA